MPPPSAEPPLVLGIDIGTQSIRAIVFDREGRRVVSTRRTTPVHDLGGGGAEYDPDELFAEVLASLAECGAGLDGVPVAGIAVASVGESFVLVDAGGRALARSPVWHDRRPEATAAILADAIGRDRIFEITGVAIESIFTLCKLAWMRETGYAPLAEARHVLCIADWIAFRLSGVAAGELTLASRTLLLDIHDRRWSDEMQRLAGFEVPLPPLRPSGTPLGPVLPDVLAETRLAGAPLVSVGGHDHVVGSLAAGLTRPGQLLDSMGTAEAILLATDRPTRDRRLMTQGFAQWAIETDRAMTMLGGGMSSSGGAIEWLRDLSGLASHDALMEAAGRVPPGSEGVVFLPHLLHAPPPEPDPAGRGAFVGLAAHVGPGAMMRAVLEGLAMQTARMVDALAELPGVGRPEEIRFIGGTSRAALPAAIKAAVFGTRLTVVDEPEATTLGAAMLAGIGAGVWPSLDAAVAEAGPPMHTVDPDPEWTAHYRDLRASVFDPLQAALTPTHHAIARLVGN